MDILRRVGYYLIGVTIGIVGVSFFWKKKDVSFDYGPNARTLKSIRYKKIQYSEKALVLMQNQNVDTVAVNQLLKMGDVKFSESKPQQKPCAEYKIYGKEQLKNLSILVERCDSVATILNVTKRK